MQGNPRKSKKIQLQGNPRKCKEMQGNARESKEVPGNARKCKGTQGDPWKSKESPGIPRQCKESQGITRNPKNIQGDPRESKEIQGNPRNSKEIQAGPPPPLTQRFRQGGAKVPDESFGHPDRMQGERGAIDGSLKRNAYTSFQRAIGTLPRSNPRAGPPQSDAPCAGGKNALKNIHGCPAGPRNFCRALSHWHFSKRAHWLDSSLSARNCY